MKGCALVLAVVLAGGFVAASSPESRSTTNVVRLKAISSRATSTGTSLVIEASEPVPYVATRPDPLTLYIDFRNVAADGITSLVPVTKGPIERVAVEPADPVGEGSPRIRVRLSEPVAHHVRSDRNTVVIDFDRTPANSARTAPDPMQSLVMSNRAGVDPIAALGLDREKAEPRAVPAALMRAAQTAPAQAAPSQAQAAPQQAEQVGTARPGVRRFTGNPVSLD